MKKQFIILLVLIMMLALCTVVIGDTVQIGTGTATTTTFPIAAGSDYSYSQQIIPQNQINHSGNISKLSFFYVSGTMQICSKDWVIYMGHTSKNSFDSTTDWIPFENLTPVFEGDVFNLYPTGGNAWMEITLTTPFNYNNSENLIIAVDENTSSWSNPNTWGAYPSGTNTGIYYGGSTDANPLSPPVATGLTGNTNRLLLVFPNTVAPLAPTLLYPDNGGWSFTNDSLLWAPTLGAGDVNSYDVYLSSDPNPLLAASDITTTSYPFTLENNTNYYWKVVAKNEIGNTSSEIRSFKTPTLSQLTESFEGDIFPPPGWGMTST